MEESGLARKLSCSCQDRAAWVPTAKPLKPNALDPKLSCSCQEDAVAADASDRAAADGRRLFSTILRVLPPSLFLVVGMFLSPLLLTFQRDLVILGVSRDLLAVIIGAPPTLALRLTADHLLGTKTEGRNELWQ